MYGVRALAGGTAVAAALLFGGCEGAASSDSTGETAGAPPGSTQPGDADAGSGSAGRPGETIGGSPGPNTGAGLGGPNAGGANGALTATDDSQQRPLVDPDIPPAIAGEDGWEYYRIAESDVDGDGVEERIVLTARVEMYRNQPAWDDGQPWQVYVEEPDGRRTYLYARYVQLGTVTMRIGLDGEGMPASVILIEHVPDQLSLYEIQYRDSGEVSAVTRFQRMVDPRGEVASPQLP